MAVINGNGATAVIPPRSNRKTPRDYDKDIYKERNLVERLFQKLKRISPSRYPLRTLGTKLYDHAESGQHFDLA
jgi:transposase